MYVFIEMSLGNKGLTQVCRKNLGTILMKFSGIFHHHLIGFLVWGFCFGLDFLFMIGAGAVEMI